MTCLDPQAQASANAGIVGFNSDHCMWDHCASDRRPEAQTLGKQLIYFPFYHQARIGALNPQLSGIAKALSGLQAPGSIDCFFSSLQFKQYKLTFPVETGSLPPSPVT